MCHPNAASCFSKQKRAWGADVVCAAYLRNLPLKQQNCALPARPRPTKTAKKTNVIYATQVMNAMNETNAMQKMIFGHSSSCGGEQICFCDGDGAFFSSGSFLLRQIR